jgi:heme/copper-type cytochrome/quinol oxidase subunit 3
MSSHAIPESNGASREWVSAASIRALPIDQTRGTAAMGWFIASEAMVFIALFFSYFYLGHDQPRWPIGDPPALALPSVMVAILFVSCIVLRAGARALARGRARAALGALFVTALLGIGFLVVNALNYNAAANLSPPTESSYTSIFFVTQGVHAAHLILGLLFLLYAALLPQLGPTDKPPHNSYRNASIYWYFVSVVWFVMYIVMFVGPHHVVGANSVLH